MNRFALMLLLLSTVAAAQNFPPCTAAQVNQVWRDPVSTNYYYCDGKNWQQISSGGGSLSPCSIDGGTFSCPADAGFGGIVGATEFCLPGNICAEGNTPYWQMDSPVLTKTGDPSMVVQGVPYFYQTVKFANSGGELLMANANQGMVLQGNCDAASTTCADNTLNSNVARTQASNIRALRIDNNGSEFFWIDYEGGVHAGFFAPGFGNPDEGQFICEATTAGSVCLTTADNNFPQIRGEKHTPAGGLHGFGITTDNHYPLDAGWIIEADNFTAGATNPSKKWFVDYQGGFGQYGNDFTAQAAPFGNAAPFDTCGYYSTDAGYGANYIAGHGESTLLYDFGPTATYYQCTQPHDGGAGSWDPLASAKNGYAGGRLQGYYSASDLASTHSDLAITCTTLVHPIVSGSAGRITAVSEKAGTTGGTFDMYVKNETNGQILCFKNSNNCTQSTGQPGSSAACTWDAGVAGDLVCLHANTTSCTGTDPGLNIIAEY